MKRLLQAVLALCLIFSYSAVQAQSGKLKGKVTDKQTKEAIIGAGVTLLAEDQKTTKAQQRTDMDGNYDFDPIDPGTYYIKVQMPSYGTQILGPKDVKANKTAIENVELDVPVGPGVVIKASKNPALDPDNTVVGESFNQKAIMSTPGGYLRLAEVSAGVHSENGETPTINGSRSYGTVYIVDGIKMQGQPNLPRRSLEGVDVITGGFPAELGDLTGGAISLTTRGPSKDFTGGLEGFTSQFLDPFGVNALEGNISGPLILKYRPGAPKNKDSATSVLGFFLAGNVRYNAVDYATPIDMYRVNTDTLNRIQQNPLSRSPIGEGYVSNAEYVTKTGMVQTRKVPNTPSFSYSLNGKLDFKPSDDIRIVVGGSADHTDRRAFIYSYSMFNYSNNPEVISNNRSAYLRFTQNFKTSTDPNALVRNAYYSIQGDYTFFNSTAQDARLKGDIFKYGYVGKFEQITQPVYFRETDTINGVPTDAWYLQNPPAKTQLKFTRGGVNPLLENYTQEYFDLQDNKVQSLDQLRASRAGLANGDFPTNIYSLWSAPGVNYTGYSHRQNEQFTLHADGGATIKNHNIKFGFQYEQRVNRLYSVGFETRNINTSPQGLWTIMRQLANRHLTQFDKSHPILTRDAQGNFTDTVNYNYQIGPNQSTFDKNLRRYLEDNHYVDENGRPITEQSLINTDALDPSIYKLSWFSPDELLNNGNSYVEYYGYDYLGNKLHGKAGVNNFLDSTKRTLGAFNPIYQAGYIQDKIEYRDLIFRLGLRIDRFDANQSVLKDPFSLYPIKTAGEVSDINGKKVTHPGNIGSDYVVYVDDAFNPTKIVGYRNPNASIGSSSGVWYDADGNEIQDPALIARAPATKSGTIQPYLENPEHASKQSELKLSEASFTSYKPQWNVMPRVSFSFPISETANFYANYDFLSVRPSSEQAVGRLDDYYFLQSRSTVLIDNPDLKPEKTINYEAGFKQLLTSTATSSSALTIQAFYKEMRDMIQRVVMNYAYPVTYTTLANIDFGTVKGLTLGYDLRRGGRVSSGVNLTVNYTLQFAEGTGSGQNSASGLLGAGQPNLRTIFPLDYDSRHQINTSIDYRFGYGEEFNATLFGHRWLENSGINLLINTRSGTPYTRQTNVTPEAEIGVQKRTSIVGEVNGERKPWQFRADLRVDKDFMLKKEMGKSKTPLFMNVYLTIQNLFDMRNVISVYRYTGLANDDGYLSSPEGQKEMQGYAVPSAFYDQYSVKINDPGHYTNPRFIRLGASINF